MFLLFWILRGLGVLRVSPEEELAGLDISEHGMHGYPPALAQDAYQGVTAPATAGM
jgi:ammonia channel protein AmtB